MCCPKTSGFTAIERTSPVDVVKEILKDAGVDADVEWKLRQTYAPREFLCQYRETEINFVHRILEEEGIFHFFLHSPDGHKLVFCDDPGAFVAQDEHPPVILAPRQGGGPGTQPLLGLERAKSLRPTEIALRDFGFEKPDVFPEAALPAPGSWPIRHFEYPGGFTAGPEGSRRARGRISALRGDVALCRGKSRAAGLVCGTPTTGNDKNETVAVNHDHSIGSNYNLTIGANETTSISANQRIDVGNALQVKVTGAQSVSVSGNDQVHAKCDFVEKVGGTRDYRVGGNQITISNGVRQDITATGRATWVRCRSTCRWPRSTTTCLPPTTRGSAL